MAKRKKTPESAPRLPDISAAARRAILKSVSDGTPKKYATAAAGVPGRTFSRYCQIAKTAPHNSAPRRFWRALKRAEAKAVSAWVAGIQRDESWQSKAWLLERLHPDSFASNRRELKELRTQLAELLTRLARLETHHDDRGASPPPPPGSGAPIQT